MKAGSAGWEARPRAIYLAGLADDLENIAAGLERFFRVGPLAEEHHVALDYEIAVSGGVAAT